MADASVWRVHFPFSLRLHRCVATWFVRVLSLPGAPQPPALSVLFRRTVCRRRALRAATTDARRPQILAAQLCGELCHERQCSKGGRPRAMCAVLDVCCAVGKSVERVTWSSGRSRVRAGACPSTSVLGSNLPTHKPNAISRDEAPHVRRTVALKNRTRAERQQNTLVRFGICLGHLRSPYTQSTAVHSTPNC
jgi:hypothetical protein